MVFRILKCHILIDLKDEPFSHENIGQLNSYVAYYAKHEMSSGDNPPIGILLCTQKNNELVEYALAGMNQKLFVSKYQLELPSKQEMEQFIRQNRAELEQGDEKRFMEIQIICTVIRFFTRNNAHLLKINVLEHLWMHIMKS